MSTFPKLLTILIIAITLPVFALTSNSHSTDLERSSSQYWSITDAAQTGLDLTGDFSISAWVKPETLPSAVPKAYGVVAKGSGAGTNDTIIMTIRNDDTLAVDVFSNNNIAATMWQRYASTPDVVTDTTNWVHLVVTFDIDTETLVMYRNGSSITSTKIGGTTLGATLYNNSAPFMIGYDNQFWSANDQFDGLIDDVRIWGRTLTSTEVSDLYTAPCTFSDGSNLVGEWLFDNSGLDETANNNDLTNNNSATFTSTTAYTCSAGASPEVPNSFIQIFGL